MPIWLESGLIFLAIVLVLSFIVGGLSQLFMIEPLSFFTCFHFPLIPLHNLACKYFPYLIVNNVSHTILCFAVWFIIGAITGIIFKKIRSYNYE